MKLLALDTSTTIGSVALIQDQGELLGEQTLCAQRSHSIYLLPAISDLLKQCGTDLKDIHCFATTVGPGSFTGVRIGISTIKAFARRTQRPVVGVSTLKVLAAGAASVKSRICAILDARQEEVYAAIYDIESNRQTVLLQDSLIRSDVLCEILDDLYAKDQKEIRIVGEIPHQVQTLFLERPFIKTVFKHKNFPRAFECALLAEQALSRGESIPAEALKPSYLKVPEAQRLHMH